MPTLYCPTRRQLRLYKDFAKSDYSGNCGSTYFDGVFAKGPEFERRFADIQDGLSNTLAVAETRIHAVHMDTDGCCGDNEDPYVSGWADDVLRTTSWEPGPDLRNPNVPPEDADRRFGSSHPAAFGALFVDGSVRTVRYNVDLELFKQVGTIAGGEPISHGGL